MVQGTSVPKPATIPLEIFQYPPVADPALPSWEAFESIGRADGRLESTESTPCNPAKKDGDDSQSAARQADALRQSFEQGRALGFEEGRAAENKALAPMIGAKEALGARQATQLLESFAGEKSRYFEALEHEVVKLALAVAARVLRREAQMDPLLLSGPVRVALGQLSASTQVRLRVPSADLELWADAMAHLPNLAPRPSVVAGEDMRLGECVLETELGSVDLAIAAQLDEIENGFFESSAGNRRVAPTAIGEDMAE